MSNEKKVIAVLIIIILMLLGLWRNQASKTQEAKDITNAITDELETERNKYGQEVAKIAVITAESKKSLLKIGTQDSTIIALQKTVKEYKGRLNTAIVLNNQTTTKGETETVVIRDTIIIDGEEQIAQYYETKWTNKWEDGYILAKPDSILRDIKVKNEYQITLGKVKNGWFKKKEYEVQVLNLNPNTTTQELRTFQVKEKPKRLSLGVQVGYGIGLLDFKFQPYVGVGLQYNIIGIK